MGTMILSQVIVNALRLETTNSCFEDLLATAVGTTHAVNTQIFVGFIETWEIEVA